IATDQKPVALAGIMGGAETEVDENTKNIIVEAATFDMYNIRRSSMRHGLFTDASTRFSKGQSPHQNLIVLNKMLSDIIEQNGAKAGLLFDSGESEAKPGVEITTEFVNARLGSEISSSHLMLLLQNVEFEVE